MDDREVEQRLAGYRPVVERAMFRQPLAPRGGRDRRRWVVSAVAAATVAVGVVGWVALGSGNEPASTGSPATTAVAATSVPDTIVEPWIFECDGGPPAADTIPLTVPCPFDGERPTLGPAQIDHAMAFGDYVMSGASRLLNAVGVVSGLEDGSSVNFDDLTRFGTTVGAFVVHLGHNGPIDPHDLDRAIEALQFARAVIVLTLRGNQDWIDSNNAMIRALPARYRNVVVLDWEVLSNECQGECFADDGAHLAADGADFYTALITNTLLTVGWRCADCAPGG